MSAKVSTVETTKAILVVELEPSSIANGATTNPDVDPTRGLCVVATPSLAVFALGASWSSIGRVVSDEPATSTDTTVRESRIIHAAPPASSTIRAATTALANQRIGRVRDSAIIAPGNPFGCQSHISEEFSASSVGCAKPIRPMRLDRSEAGMPTPRACDMRPIVRSRKLPGGRLIGKIPETVDPIAAAFVRPQRSHSCK